MTFETDDVSLANIVVSLNGTPISMSLYSVGPVVNANLGPIETYIGDVSAFSGQQNVVLRFETVPTGDPYFGTADLDNIQFSSTPAPEPSTLFLLLAALLSSAGYYWHRRSDVPKAR